jgi:hypothetical protein
VAVSFIDGRKRSTQRINTNLSKVTDKFKTHLKETIHKTFSHRNDGSKFDVLGYNSTYFSNKIQKGKTLPEGMFKEVMKDLWLGLYVVLAEVLLTMPNSLIRHW